MANGFDLMEQNWMLVSEFNTYQTVVDKQVENKLTMVKGILNLRIMEY